MDCRRSFMHNKFNIGIHLDINRIIDVICVWEISPEYL